jgi:serine/threonine protein kinase
MVGTPSFMSPEQITGQAVGPQSDIFAVGIILYQFLTNERPFRGAGVFAVQQKILYEQPMPPSLINPLLDPAFDRIVMRALAKSPDQRYSSAHSFRDDLKRALNGESLDQPNVAQTLPLWRLAAAGAGSADPDATLVMPAAAAVAAAADDDATLLYAAPRLAS